MAALVVGTNKKGRQLSTALNGGPVLENSGGIANVRYVSVRNIQ
jgi:hypothetical protein